MLKVLWVVNVPIPKISEALGIPVKDNAGWLTGFANEIEQYDDIELNIAFPLLGEEKKLSGNVGKIRYISFYQKPIHKKIKVPTNKIGQLTKKHICEIINEINPDILHLFGTEYEYSLIAAKLFNKPLKTLVHIQGLTSVYAMHYYAGLPTKVLKKFALSNLIRGSILKQQKKFEMRGKSEIELLKYIGNVSGRTEWDKACVKRINPQIKYYFCNESLRDEFYKNSWDISKCEKHSIFMSQASYPIKGVHFMIEALPDIIKCFPDTHLYIAGNDITITDGLYNKMRVSSYGLYIKELIKKNKLDEYITFTGFLDEKQMCKRYLKTNVFVSASTIENSPNSVGEALILGIPTISSDVGGVKDFISHASNGFIYQYDATYMLAYYVNQIFENDSKAIELSENAKKTASIAYNRKINIDKLVDIYNKINH